MTKDEEAGSPPHYLGHRERLRDRFRKGGAAPTQPTRISTCSLGGTLLTFDDTSFIIYHRRSIPHWNLLQENLAISMADFFAGFSISAYTSEEGRNYDLQRDSKRLDERPRREQKPNKSKK